MKPLIGVIMGSQSDWPVMKGCKDVFDHFKVPFEVKVVSAHRTPELMEKYVKQAQKKGIRVIIAGAGGAAHLPGMISSLTHLPVIGVPVNINSLKGLDSFLSIAQMPKDVPVATVAIDNSHNAALLSVRILSLNKKGLKEKLKTYMKKYKKKVSDSNRTLKDLIEKIND